MELGLGLRLRQNIELVQLQRIQLALGLAPPIDDSWLTGKPKDLHELLTQEPQLDNNDRLRYIVSGGWAVEFLTGKKREHHDLDIISVSRKPLIFKVDEQNAKNYFQTLSMTTNELLENHVVEVEWDFNDNYKELELEPSNMTLYVASPEFLFLSKIAGFKREPRDKDLDDLEALSSIDYKYSVSTFRDLIGHIIGLQPYFHENTKLFMDLGVEADSVEGARAHAVRYLTDIIKNFRAGNNDAARMQAKTFHSTLIKVYDQGLEGAIMNNTDIDPDIASQFITDNKLDAFYIIENGNPKLAILPTKKSNRTLPKLKLWSKIQKLFPEYYLADLTELSSCFYDAKFCSEDKEIHRLIDYNGNAKIDENFKSIIMTAPFEGDTKKCIFGVGEKKNYIMDNKGGLIFITANRSFKLDRSMAYDMLELNEYDNFLNLSDLMKDNYDADITDIATSFMMRKTRSLAYLLHTTEYTDDTYIDQIDKLRNSLDYLRVSVKDSEIVSSAKNIVRYAADKDRMGVVHHAIKKFGLEGKSVIGEYIDQKITAADTIKELMKLRSLSLKYQADNPSKDSVDKCVDNYFNKNIRYKRLKADSYIRHLNQIFRYAKKFGHEPGSLTMTLKSISDSLKYRSKEYGEQFHACTGITLETVDL